MKKILLAVLFCLCISNFAFAANPDVAGEWLIEGEGPPCNINVTGLSFCSGGTVFSPSVDISIDWLNLGIFVVSQSADGTIDGGWHNLGTMSYHLSGEITGDSVNFEIVIGDTLGVNTPYGPLSMTVTQDFSGKLLGNIISGGVNATYSVYGFLSSGTCAAYVTGSGRSSGTFRIELDNIEPSVISFLDKADLSRQVIGAAADGASKVVIQITGLPEDITSDDIQISIPSGARDGSLENDKKISSRVFTQTYVVPSCFVRNGHPEDLTAQEREIGLSIIVKGEQIDHEPFTLVRPPVVLLHGLWAADPPIWTGLKAYLKSNGFNVVNDNPYPDDYSFKQNHYVVHALVDRALAEAQQQGLVAKKADIVGHSMGGILIKKYGNSSYIRRVVTIGTPHLGSPWANWLLAHPWLEGILNWYGGKSMRHGAILDLQTGVCNVPGDSLKVPVLAIAGSSSSDTFPGSGGDVFSAIYSLATLGLGTPSQVHTALFGTDSSDWVVSVPSQAGGLTATVVPGIWHLEEPGNSNVFSKVVGFLNAAGGAAGTAVVQSMQPQIQIGLSVIASSVPQTYTQLAEAGGEITITAPLAGSTYSPGDTVHVVLVAPPTTTKVWVATPGSPAVISETLPFVADITIPQEAIGQCGIIAVALDGQVFLAMTSTVVNVTTPANVTALKVWPDSVLYLRTNDTVPFVVHGVFSDGVERDVTTSQCGTIYNTTDSLVASIDANGVLTAKAPGYCLVTMSNGNSMQIPVWVLAPPLKYSGGSGTDYDPYQIANAADLLMLAADTNDYDSCFILMADIDLDPNLPGNQIFTTAVIAPETDNTKWDFGGVAFSGTFDGAGHKVSNLTINTNGAGNDYLGLFGYVSGEIKNFGLENVSITGGDESEDIGGLVGENGGTITDCYSTGTVGGSNSWAVGGLVGSNDYGTISDCYSTGNVTGKSGFGGLAGCSFFSTINNCYSTGTVTGGNESEDLGGLLGRNDWGSVTTNCYSTGTVTGGDNSGYIGGLAGYNYSATISNCYSTGAVTGGNNSDNLGGLVGYNNDGRVLGSFWDKNTSGKATSDGGTGKTTAKMKTLSTFTSAGWDFVNETINGTCNYWQLSTGAYPVLSTFNGYIPPEPLGSGTPQHPYIIADANDLGTIWYRPAAHYILANNINLAGIGWSMAVVPAFSGVLDGNGFCIKNLSITGAGYLGLFGWIEEGGSVQNLGIKNCIVSGSYYVGGFAGENYGSISICYSTGSISGSYYVGGLVGYNESFNSINNCYSTCSVNGSDCVGGLVGYNWSEISDCYSAGTVTGGIDSNYLGGLWGYNYDDEEISGCYFLDTSGLGDGLTDGQMKQQGSFAGWDFVGETANGAQDIWSIIEGVSYPKFVWQSDTTVSGVIQVTKCTVTAGSKDNSDKISFSGTMDANADDFNDADTIEVTIDSNDIVNPCVLNFPIDANTFKNGKYSYSKTAGGIKKSFTYDVKTGKFTFAAANADLSGLVCPLTVRIEINSYVGAAEVNETVVNGPKKPIPINLMMGVKDVLRVDKCQVKHGKKLNSDQLSVKGAFAVEDTGVNMVNEEFVVTLGAQTFTLPVGSFKANKGGFTCTKADVTEDDSIAAATFNFNLCSFILTIKNTTITAGSGAIDFCVAFADFNEVERVTLP